MSDYLWAVGIFALVLSPLCIPIGVTVVHARRSQGLMLRVPRRRRRMVAATACRTWRILRLRQQTDN